MMAGKAKILLMRILRAAAPVNENSLCLMIKIFVSDKSKFEELRD
jgi:hypothetical protein